MSFSRDEGVANPSRAPQQPDARTSVPCEELRQEPRRADRDPGDIFRTPTDTSTAHRWPRWLLGRVIILAFGGRASASTGGQKQWSQDIRRRGRTAIDDFHTRECVQSDAA